MERWLCGDLLLVGVVEVVAEAVACDLVEVAVAVGGGARSSFLMLRCSWVQRRGHSRLVHPRG